MFRCRSVCRVLLIGLGNFQLVFSFGGENCEYKKYSLWVYCIVDLKILDELPVNQYLGSKQATKLKTWVWHSIPEFRCKIGACCLQKYMYIQSRILFIYPINCASRYTCNSVLHSKAQCIFNPFVAAGTPTNIFTIHVETYITLPLVLGFTSKTFYG
jgi:hypothetical protein